MGAAIDFVKEAEERVQRMKGKNVPSQSASLTAPPQGGAKPSAASGGGSEAGEWQRSEKSRESESPTIFPGHRNRGAKPSAAGGGESEAGEISTDNPSTAGAVPLPLHRGGFEGGANHAGEALGEAPVRGNRDAMESTGETEQEQLRMPPAMVPRYMSREDWHNMERAAARGLMPDETVTPARRMLYFTMVGLYAAVAAGVMPPGVAKAEKRMAIEAYNRMSADADLFRQTGDFFKGVEAATTAYGKRACFANAETMYHAVLRAMPKTEHREENWNDRRTENILQNNETENG